MKAIQLPTAKIGLQRAAALLDCTPRFLRDKVRAGEISGTKLGTKVVLDVASLNEFIRNSSIGK
jgi:excisionase family DNA binding protein